MSTTARKVGLCLLEDATTAGDGLQVHYLDPGIYFVEVIDSSDMGSATVSVKGTCDPDADDFKTEAELTLTSSAASGMIRGGRNVIASVTGTPSAAIDCYITRASN